MIVELLAASLLAAMSAPGDHDPPRAETPDTLMDDIKTTWFPQDGWTFLTDSPVAIVFFRYPIQRQGGLPRISTRWEFAKPGTGAAGRYLSLQLVQRVDCISGTMQAAERSTHRSHNLQGPAIDEISADEPWSAPEPGSLEEAVLKKACAPL
jgi:hypothetical protein